MPSDAQPIEVALFPIPGVVAFPGTVLPLHVFEPRYRQLVHDCVDEERMVGVSHTLKTIHQPKRAQTPEEALRSNQATYKAHDVFSAGHCSIVETTADGRILATVAVSRRLTPVEELQSLPYRIVSCVPVEDEEEPVAGDEYRFLMESIHNRLIELVGAESPELARDLKNPAWAAFEPREYSFRIFQVLRFEPDVMQTILETRSAVGRLEMIRGLLGGQGG